MKRKAGATQRRSQADRTQAMRTRLIDATIAALVDCGYAKATAVEICRRANVTRGALLHHFADLTALFEASLERLYDDLGRAASEAEDLPAVLDARALVESMWSAVSRPSFKAVIEIWLAARNDPAVAERLQSAIRRLGAAVNPELNADMRRALGGGTRAVSYFLLVRETLIGLALGRAVTPEGEMGHERRVLNLLVSIAPG